MAETKKRATKKTKAVKAKAATYKGKTFEVLERSGNMVKLTDGQIHFWAKASDVDAD